MKTAKILSLLILMLLLSSCCIGTSIFLRKSVPRPNERLVLPKWDTEKYTKSLFYNQKQTGTNQSVNTDTNTGPEQIQIEKNNQEQNFFWHIKAVPGDVSDSDLDLIAGAGFKIISTEWGIDDLEYADVQNLLDRLNERGLKIILDAGSSPYAWGYKDDGGDSLDQRPIWQKEKVQNWVKNFKHYPSVYGWDISNEAGENFPNGDKFRISLKELKQAAADVRAVDATHPIIIRMHYWDDEDGDFTWQNPFEAGIADIVILNLYSNYSEDGSHILLPDMIKNSAQILVDKLLAVEPQIKIWLSLAAFEDQPMFLKPSADNLNRDVQQALQVNGLESVGFFGWKLEEDDWYLLRDGEELFRVIQSYIERKKLEIGN